MIDKEASISIKVAKMKGNNKANNSKKRPK